MSRNIFLESNNSSEFAKSLSVERLSTYCAFAEGRMTDSLRLYTRNTAISAAFYRPLQGLETALRNAMHLELSWRYGPSWFDNPDTGLDECALRNFDRARWLLVALIVWLKCRRMWRRCRSVFASRSLNPAVNGIQAARRTMRRRNGDRHRIARFRPARTWRAGWLTSY